jgi:hypothetical protein
MGTFPPEIRMLLGDCEPFRSHLLRKKMANSPIMKTKIALLLAVLWPLAGHAQTWDTTLTETITSTDNPAYYDGETFTNVLSYQSSTANGTFYTAWLPSGPAEPNTTLTGYIFAGLPGYPQFSVTAGWPYLNYLTVSNGEVTDFTWTTESGLSDPWFGEAPAAGPLSFALFTGNNAPQVLGQPYVQAFITSGYDTFSAPVTAPDGGKTWAMLGAGLAGLFAWTALEKRLRILTPGPR